MKESNASAPHTSSRGIKNNQCRLDKIDALIQARSFRAAEHLIRWGALESGEELRATKVLLGLGKNAEALAVCNSIVNPDKHLLFQCLVKMGRFAEATHLIGDLKDSPEFASLQIQLFGLSGDRDGMLAALETHLQATDVIGKANLYVSAAMPSLQRGEFQEALDYYYRASEFAELCYHDFINVSWALHKLGLHSEAYSSILKADALREVSDPGLRLQLKLATLVKDYVAALKALNLLVELGYESAETMCLARVKLLMLTGNVTQAVEHLDDALRSSKSLKIRVASAILLLLLGKPRRLFKWRSRR